MKRLSRVLPGAMLLASFVVAGPPLTTIQDVLYKADGTPFNGLVNIAWTSFEAQDTSDIPPQIVTTKVINGNLRVQLVPNTTSDPATLYSVTYNSDGRVQFAEQWAVPPSAKPLRIRDVRVAANAGNVANDGQTPIPESQVTGLVGDLGARPMKGPGFIPGAVAVVNPQGAIDSVSGSPADCVHVDGSSGPCGTPQPLFMDGDIPGGLVDGSNASFTLSATPNPASSLAVYRNGLLQEPGTDYNLTNGSRVQFTSGNQPQPGDTLLASYRLPGGNGAGQLYPNPQVLCSGVGASVNSGSYSNLGTCTIPGGVLLSGERVQIRFDLAHPGTSGGFNFQVLWGGTTILQRSAAATDAQVSGHLEAGLDQAGAQVTTQSWGTVLPFSAGIGSAQSAYGSGLIIAFQGAMNVAGDVLNLRNFSVVRVP